MVKDRMSRIEAAAELAVVKSRDSKGRVRTLTVPGHSAYRFLILGRVPSSDPTVTVECHRQTDIGLVPCRGNGQYVCYHSLGGVKAALTDAGATLLKFYDSRNRAIGSANLKQYRGAQLGLVRAKRNGSLGGKIWFLWRPA